MRKGGPHHGGAGELLTSAVPSKKPWTIAPTEKEDDNDAIVPVIRWRW